MCKRQWEKGPQALPSHCCQVVISVQYNFHGAAQLRTEGLTRFKIRGSFAQDIHKTSPRECSHHTRGQSILPKTVKQVEQLTLTLHILLFTARSFIHNMGIPGIISSPKRVGIYVSQIHVVTTKYPGEVLHAQNKTGTLDKKKDLVGKQKLSREILLL